MGIIYISEKQAISLDKEDVDVQAIFISKIKCSDKVYEILSSDIELSKKIRRLKRFTEFLRFFVKDIR